MTVFSKCKVTQNRHHSIRDAKMFQEKYDEVKPIMEKEVENFKNFFSPNNREIISHADCFSMNMKRNRLGLYTFHIHIQGKKYTFLIDTGAQISGILAQSAKKMKTTKLKQTIDIGSVGGKKKVAQCVQIEDLYLGAIQIKKQPFVVLDDKDFSLPYVNIKVMHFDGIIGWDILSQFDFELDGKNLTFSVIRQAYDEGYQNFIPSSFPCVVVKDQNKQAMVFGFDSGAKDSWLSSNYVKDAKLDVVAQQHAIGMGVLGIEKMKLLLIKECSITIHNRKIRMENIRTGRTDIFKEYEVAGVLGNRMIRDRKLQIINSKQFIQLI